MKERHLLQLTVWEACTGALNNTWTSCSGESTPSLLGGSTQRQTLNTFCLSTFHVLSGSEWMNEKLSEQRSGASEC